MTDSVSEVVGKIEETLGYSPSSRRVVVRRWPASKPTSPSPPAAVPSATSIEPLAPERARGVGQRAGRDEHDVARVGRRGVPVQLAHRQAVAVGGEQRHRVALDLDPHAGEDRQGVAAVGRDGHLGDGLGEQVAVDGAAGLGRGRQRRVVVGRHHQQAEPRGAAGDLHLRAVGGDVDRPVGQVARDVGEQPAEHEHGAGLGDLGGDGDLGRDLVVERRQGQRAVVVGLHQDAGEHRHRGTGGEAARHPGDRLGQDVALDAELHGLPPSSGARTRACSCTPEIPVREVGRARARRRRRRGHDTSARLAVRGT